MGGSGIPVMISINTFTIRPATPSDYESVVACIHASFNKWIPVMGMKPLALGADYHDHINRGVTSVLEADEQAAVAGVLIFWPVEGALYLDTIAVHPMYQKHGLGRRLLEYTEQKAREMSLNSITLVTNEKMVANQEYYLKHGFVETHRDSLEHGRVGVWMRKSLAAE